MRRVVVTGMGIVSPVGRGLDANWKGITAGKSVISPITSFDTTEFVSKVGGFVPKGKEAGQFDADSVISPKEQRHMDEFIVYAIAAATDAVEDSGWVAQTDEDKERFEDDFVEDDHVPDFIPSAQLNKFVFNEDTVDTVLEDLMEPQIAISN